MSRLRRGEWIALIGSTGLFVVLFLDWFGLEKSRLPETSPFTQALADRFTKTGWDGVGWLLALLLALLIVGGLLTALLPATRASVAWPVGAAVLTAALGAIIVLVLAVRLLTQPGLGGDVPNRYVDVRLAADLGLLFAALIPIGAWIVLDDDRTTAPESAYTPPPPRPVPGT